MTPDECINRQEQLETERATWEQTWQDIIDYCIYNRYPVIGHREPGEIEHDFIYDSTAYKSLMRLAAALNSMLTNQSSEWFQLTTDDQEANEIPEVAEWLDKVSQEIREAFENSNFYTEVHEMYIDMASIGTGILYIEDSPTPEKDLNFSTRHIREIYMAEDPEGTVDTIFRKFKMTAKQVFQKWGDKVSDAVKSDYEKAPDEEHFILHCVYPREERNSSKRDTKNMPWASQWIEIETRHVLGEGGYEVFPYVVPRWTKTSGEKYGRSPALAALPDIKTLNAMVETLLKTGQKIADPPLQVPEETIDVDLTPGGINYFDAQLDGRIEPIIIGANLPITHDLVTELRDSVRDTFYVTQLQLIDKRDMTAEETRVRTDENMRVLGPTFGRLQSEFMERLVTRVLNILQYILNVDGTPRIPVPPEVIQGKQLRLKYMSPLAKAQKFDEYRSITTTVNIAGQWAGIDPSVLDNINFDVALRMTADLDGTPKKLFNDPETIQAIRQNRAQQQQVAQQLQMAEAQADIKRKEADSAKKIAQAQSENE